MFCSLPIVSMPHIELPVSGDNFIVSIIDTAMMREKPPHPFCDRHVPLRIEQKMKRFLGIFDIIRIKNRMLILHYWHPLIGQLYESTFSLPHTNPPPGSSSFLRTV